jgi:hypothetical protein
MSLAYLVDHPDVGSLLGNVDFNDLGSITRRDPAVNIHVCRCNLFVISATLHMFPPAQIPPPPLSLSLSLSPPPPTHDRTQLSCGMHCIVRSSQRSEGRISRGQVGTYRKNDEQADDLCRRRRRCSALVETRGGGKGKRAARQAAAQPATLSSQAKEAAKS